MKFVPIYLLGASLFLLLSCQSDPHKNLRDSLTFYASFDQEQADLSLGDPLLYNAPSRRALDSTQLGLAVDVHSLEKSGKWGNSLRFQERVSNVLFFKGKQNINYDPKNWSGTISFWLQVDPGKDLAPGYTDPIQITDTRYDDAAIWVDFTNENPRDFRLGIIGDVASWEQDTIQTSAREEFEKRLVPVKSPPFNNEKWTHVVIVFESLGTANSKYELFLDGTSQGSKQGFDDPFTWDLEKSNIYLGLGFIGLLDELAIFNRPFSNEEVMQLNQMQGPFEF